MKSSSKPTPIAQRSTSNTTSTNNIAVWEVRLRMACRDGLYDMVIECLTTVKGMNIGSTDSTGWTCFHYACQFGHSNIIQYIIQEYFIVQQQSNINQLLQLLHTKNRTHGNTPLHCAVESGHVPIVKYMIELYPTIWNKATTTTSTNNANANNNIMYESRNIYTIKNSNKETIYDIARRNNHIEMIYLIQKNSGGGNTTNTQRSEHHHHHYHSEPFTTTTTTPHSPEPSRRHSQEYRHSQHHPHSSNNNFDRNQNTASATTTTTTPPIIPPTFLNASPLPPNNNHHPTTMNMNKHKEESIVVEPMRTIIRPSPPLPPPPPIETATTTTTTPPVLVTATSAVLTNIPMAMATPTHHVATKTTTVVVVPTVTTTKTRPSVPPTKKNTTTTTTTTQPTTGNVVVPSISSTTQSTKKANTTTNSIPTVRTTTDPPIVSSSTTTSSSSPYLPPKPKSNTTNKHHSSSNRTRMDPITTTTTTTTKSSKPPAVALPRRLQQPPGTISHEASIVNTTTEPSILLRSPSQEVGHHTNVHNNKTKPSVASPAANHTAQQLPTTTTNHPLPNNNANMEIQKKSQPKEPDVDDITTTNEAVEKMMEKEVVIDVSQWNSKIIKATRMGDYDDVVQLLSLPSVVNDPITYDINCKCVNGYSPLQWATLRGHDTIVEYMLRHHFRNDTLMIRSMLYAKSSFGSNVLQLACSKGNMVLSQLFVDIVAMTTTTTTTTTTDFIECQNEAGWTSLHYACNFGHLNILQYLTRNCVPEALYIVDEDGETILHRCCYHTDRLPMVQYIIECDDKNYCDTGRDSSDQLIHRLSYKGETAYDIAVKYKHNDVANYLWTVMTSVPAKEENAKSCTDDDKMPMDRSLTLLPPTRLSTNEQDDHAKLKSTGHHTTLPCDQSVTLAAMPIRSTNSTATPVTTTRSAEEVQQWNELFMSAVESGDLDTAKLCIETECIDIDQTKKVDDDGDVEEECTALHLACMYNHFDIVQYLVEYAGMNPTIKSSHYGSTVLHIATRNGALNIIQYFIDSFLIDVESIDHDGKTALHLASQLGQFDVVTYLLEFGRANYVTKDKNGCTALQLACRYGRTEVAQYLAERYSADVQTIPPTTRDSDIHAAFWLACRYGHFPIVKHFIEKNGIDVNMKNENDGMTAILFACQYGVLPFVQFLCEDYQADIHTLDKLGNSALDKAKTYGHKEVVAYMSEQYTQLSQVAEQLRNAAKFGNLIDVMDCIDKHPRLNINAGGSTGKTALHYCIANGHYEIVQYLVEHRKANVNQRTVDGATPLHYACRYGHLKCVQFLCNDERHTLVDLSIMDNQNETALDKAKKYGHVDIVQFFENRTTVNIHGANETSDTPDPILIPPQPNDESKKDVTQYCNDAEPVFVVAERVYPLEIEKCDNEKMKAEAPSPEQSSLLVNDTAVENTEVITLASTRFEVENCEEVAPLVTSDFPADSDKAAQLNTNIDNQPEPDIVVQEHLNDESDHNGFMDRTVIELNESPANDFIIDVNSDNDESQDESKERIDEVEDFFPTEITTQPKLNEAKLLDMMDKLQKENQKLMNLFEKHSALGINKNESGAANTSSLLSEDKRELLDELLGEKFNDHRDELERQAILANPTHRDFYLLLSRKLYCMINSCENLSTGMVPSENKDITRAYKSTMLRDTPKHIRDTAMAGIGIVVSTALTVAKEIIPGVKIVAEPMHAMFNVIVSLKSKRDQYLAVARVADFANAASILQAGNSKALQSTVETFARLMIRARSSLTSFPFTEKQDQFGRVKQYMVNLLADSGNTPIKEQASLAADCALAHIMMPSAGSILNDILNGDHSCDANLSEALASAILNISIDEVRSLDRYSREGTDINKSQNIDNPSPNMESQPKNMMTFVVQPSSDDENDDDFDFEGYTGGMSNDDSHNSRPVPSNTIDVEQLEDKVTLLERKIEGLSKVQSSLNTKLKKEDVNSAGDGLMYADFREQYKDDVNMLKRHSVDAEERVSFHASEIAILKEQVKILQKQLSESTVASSTQLLPAPKERAKTDKPVDRKRWLSRRRDPKDP